MKTGQFRCLEVRETNRNHEKNRYTIHITEKSFASLPSHDTLVRVHYSSLNYKDALSMTGHTGVTKSYPHVPGIDAAGEVIECLNGRFSPGDKVIVTGYDLGQNTSGGYGRYIRIPSNWAVKKPDGLTLRQAMIYGTAGFTAGQCLHHLMHSGLPQGAGEILVSGSTGGVGCLAVALLAKQGYTVVAATGKDRADWLKKRGAAWVIPREEIADNSKKPLLSVRWAGAVDTVGGDILSGIIKTTQMHGVIASCGMTRSHELNTTVYPFILRGLRLIGINSAECPAPLRLDIWQHLAEDWSVEGEAFAQIIELEEVEKYARLILMGDICGRVVIHHREE